MQNTVSSNPANDSFHREEQPYLGDDQIKIVGDIKFGLMNNVINASNILGV